MNEVEKMYKNAGIKKFEPKEEFSLDDCEEYCIDNNCKECSWRKYPQFTAEKQLELIKWLALRDDFCMMAWQNSEYHIEHDKYNANENSLEGCLARLINNFWQDLTEEERKQIKNILESEVRE